MAQTSETAAQKGKRKPRVPIGAHWNDTGYPKLYQLHRRTEDLAEALDYRRRKGWAATKEHIEELSDIAAELKLLDMERRSGR